MIQLAIAIVSLIGLGAVLGWHLAAWWLHAGIPITADGEEIGLVTHVEITRTDHAGAGGTGVNVRGSTSVQLEDIPPPMGPTTPVE